MYVDLNQFNDNFNRYTNSQFNRYNSADAQDGLDGSGANMRNGVMYDAYGNRIVLNSFNKSIYGSSSRS